MTEPLSNVRITFTGGTDEEVSALTDAITYVLLEHGFPLGEIKAWDE